MFANGYYIETTNLATVEMVLNEMREALKKSAEKVFHKQLSAEIENLVDAITVGTVTRPENVTIYDAAVALLRDKINKAGNVQADTAYNYNVAVNVFVLEKRTYFKVNSTGDFYKKAFNRIHSLQEFPLGEEWEEIIEKYKNAPIFWMQLLSGNDLEDNREYLKFSKKMDRAEKLARHNCTNHLLSQYACGEEIPPYKLMEYMDLAMNDMIYNSFCKEELAKSKAKAMTFLVDITDELIFGKTDE